MADINKLFNMTLADVTETLYHYILHCGNALTKGVG